MNNEVAIRLHQCRCLGVGEIPEDRCRERISLDVPFCAWCEGRHSESAGQMGRKVFFVNLVGEKAEG